MSTGTRTRSKTAESAPKKDSTSKASSPPVAAKKETKSKGSNSPGTSGPKPPQKGPGVTTKGTFYGKPGDVRPTQPKSKSQPSPSPRVPNGSPPSQKSGSIPRSGTSSGLLSPGPRPSLPTEVVERNPARDRALETLDEETHSSDEDSELDVSDSDLTVEERQLLQQWHRVRGDLAWRWEWLRLQVGELKQQMVHCNELYGKHRRSKQKLVPLISSSEAPDEVCLRTAGLSQLRRWRKLIRRPPPATRSLPPLDPVPDHPLFSGQASLPELPEMPLPPPPVAKTPKPKTLRTSIGGATSADMEPEIDILTVEEPEPPIFVSPRKAPTPSTANKKRPLHRSMSALAVQQSPVKEGDEDPDNLPLADTPQRPQLSRSLDLSAPPRSDGELSDEEGYLFINRSTSSHRKKSRPTRDFDINNIVVPLSMIVLPPKKEIFIPTVREINEDDDLPPPPSLKEEKKPAESDASGAKPAPEMPSNVRLISESADLSTTQGTESSEEDTSDEFYAIRHAPREKEERARWEGPILAEIEKKKKRQRKGAKADGMMPDNFMVTGGEEGTEAVTLSTPKKPKPQRKLQFGQKSTQKKTPAPASQKAEPRTPYRPRRNRSRKWAFGSHYCDLDWEITYTSFPRSPRPPSSYLTMPRSPSPALSDNAPISSIFHPAVLARHQLSSSTASLGASLSLSASVDSSSAPPEASHLPSQPPEPPVVPSSGEARPIEESVPLEDSGVELIAPILPEPAALPVPSASTPEQQPEPQAMLAPASAAAEEGAPPALAEVPAGDQPPAPELPSVCSPPSPFPLLSSPSTPLPEGRESLTLTQSCASTRSDLSDSFLSPPSLPLSVSSVPFDESSQASVPPSDVPRAPATPPSTDLSAATPPYVESGASASVSSPPSLPSEASAPEAPAPFESPEAPQAPAVPMEIEWPQRLIIRLRCINPPAKPPPRVAAMRRIELAESSSEYEPSPDPEESEPGPELPPMPPPLKPADAAPYSELVDEISLIPEPELAASVPPDSASLPLPPLPSLDVSSSLPEQDTVMPVPMEIDSVVSPAEQADAAALGEAVFDFLEVEKTKTVVIFSAETPAVMQDLNGGDPSEEPVAPNPSTELSSASAPREEVPPQMEAILDQGTPGT